MGQVLGSVLDDWEENLAIITANRTKDDELVIVHMGDCLWKERGEVCISTHCLVFFNQDMLQSANFKHALLTKVTLQVTAAHTCYLVAEANFEPYSDASRLCLIGADHWRCPRTYACPEAIQVSTSVFVFPSFV